MQHNPELYAVPILAPTSVRINGRDLREFGFELTSYPNILMPPIREQLQVIDNRSGSRDHGAVYDNWSFSLSGQIVGLTHQDLVDKQTKLLRWIDMQQHRQAEWLVSQKSVRSLKLELAGHKYWYDAGTISLTTGSAAVSGTGTKWLNFLQPNSEIWISGSKYIIQSVGSNTQLTLSTTWTAGNQSNIAYQAERKRYLLVNYSGQTEISSITHAHFQTRVMNIVLGFRTTYPCWVADEFEHEQSTITAGTFIELYGVGTALFRPTLQIIGSATDPKVCTGDVSFVARYDGEVNARNLLNETDIMATGTFIYKPTQHDKGVYIASSTTCYYSSVPTYRRKFGFVIRLIVNFASTTADDKVAFQHYYNADNGFTLFYDASDDDWVLDIESATVSNVTIRTTVQQVFSFGLKMEISGWYDADGRDIEGTTYYGKMFINGVEVGSTTSAVTAPVSNPDKLYVGSNSSGALQITSIIDDLIIFTIAPRDEDLISYYVENLPPQNTNTTIAFTGALAADDILTIDGSNGISKTYDDSTVTESAADANLSGQFPVLRGDEDELSLIYLPNAITKLRITYQPHFR